jgi:hypothetical protein
MTTSLLEKQNEMRSKMERLARRLASKPKPPKPKPLTPARAVRIFLAQELRKAYVIRRKKRQAHLRYFELKRSKKKLTKALLAEMRTMLREFGLLNAEMKTCRDALRGALRTHDHLAKQFQMGYELGKEQTEINTKETQQ